MSGSSSSNGGTGFVWVQGKTYCQGAGVSLCGECDGSGHDGRCTDARASWEKCLEELSAEFSSNNAPEIREIKFIVKAIEDDF